MNDQLGASNKLYKLVNDLMEARFVCQKLIADAMNLPADNSDSLIGVDVVKKGQEVSLATKKGKAIHNIMFYV